MRNRFFSMVLGMLAFTVWPLLAESWEQLESGGYASESRTVVAYSQPQPASRVLETARSFEGLPYKWAGTSPADGFDCSGFVHEVLRLNGYQVPRMVHHQFDKSERVEREALSPGDMVFFETYVEGPSHVGFYIGEDQFIHASSSGRGVIVSNLNSPYYSERFLGGGRPVGWLSEGEVVAEETELLEPNHRYIQATPISPQPFPTPVAP